MELMKEKQKKELNLVIKILNHIILHIKHKKNNCNEIKTYQINIINKNKFILILNHNRIQNKISYFKNEILKIISK